MALALLRMIFALYLQYTPTIWFSQVQIAYHILLRSMLNLGSIYPVFKGKTTLPGGP